MAVTWKIKRESGTEIDFNDALIRQAVKKCINQDIDTCEIAFSFGNIISHEPWDYDEEICILRDAVVFFRGWVRGYSPSATGATSELSISLVGPWWHLENLVYMQTSSFVDDPDADPTPAGSALAITDFTLETSSSSKIFIGQDRSNDRVNTQEMIEDVLDYAISKGAPFQKGTLDTGIDIPLEAFDTVTCAEVIRKCLRWTPDQTTRFDYTTDPPTLHIRKRDNLSATTIDIADEETVEVAIRPRQDLQVPGVRIEYIQNNERDGFTFRTQSVDEAGTDTTGIGAVIVPVELFGSYVFNGSVVAAETPPSGIAQMVYNHWSQLHYEGRILFVKEDCLATDWLSYKARVVGGHPDWSTMDAVIQASIDTIATSGHGQTELTIGPPQHLSPQDLINLLRAGKTEIPSIDEALTKTGGGSARTSRVPSNAIDPRLEFDLNHPPDVVVNPVEVWYQNPPSSPSYKRCKWDFVDIYDTQGGTWLGYTGTHDIYSSRAGSVVDFYGLSVGFRSAITTYGESGSYPAGVSPPQYVKYYHYYVDTKTLVQQSDNEISGGYLSL